MFTFFEKIRLECKMSVFIENGERQLSTRRMRLAWLLYREMDHWSKKILNL